MCLTATAGTATATHIAVVHAEELIEQIFDVSTQPVEGRFKILEIENVSHFLIGLYSPAFAGSGFSTFSFVRRVASAS